MRAVELVAALLRGVKVRWAGGRGRVACEPGHGERAL